MEVICIILIVSSLSFSTGLANYACTWWDRFQQRRTLENRRQEELERNKLFARKISKFDSPAAFCVEIEHLCNYCSVQLSKLDEDLIPNHFHSLELFHAWNGKEKTIKSFLVPSIGTKLCLIKNELWVTFQSHDGHHISSLLYEGVTNQILDAFLKK